MTNAREIIAQTLGHHPGWSRTADAILAALTAAGFRIVGPGGVDAETVEKCAEVADAEAAKHQGPFTSQPAYVASCAIRDALRDLKEKRPVPERFARLSPDPRAVIPDEASGELTAISTAELIALKEKQG